MIYAHLFIPSASDRARCQTCGESKAVWNHSGFGPDSNYYEEKMKPQDTPKGRELADQAIDEIVGVPPPKGTPKRTDVWLERISLILIGATFFMLAHLLKC